MAKSAELLCTKVHWIPGVYMLADSLTKRLGNGTLLRWMMTKGQYALTKSALGTLWETPLVDVKRNALSHKADFPSVSVVPAQEEQTERASWPLSCSKIVRCRFCLPFLRPRKGAHSQAMVHTFAQIKANALAQQMFNHRERAISCNTENHIFLASAVGLPAPPLSSTTDVQHAGQGGKGPS